MLFTVVLQFCNPAFAFPFFLVRSHGLDVEAEVSNQRGIENPDLIRAYFLSIDVKVFLNREYISCLHLLAQICTHKRVCVERHRLVISKSSFLDARLALRKGKTVFFTGFPFLCCFRCKRDLVRIATADGIIRSTDSALSRMDSAEAKRWFSCYFEEQAHTDLASHLWAALAVSAFALSSRFRVTR
jgi:hypothetical protein